MRYHQYYPVDIVNGPGTRCTLFVSGCVHECPGCYNKSTWRLNSGQPFTKEMEDKIIADLNDTRIHRQGISLSGGDPLHPQKRTGYPGTGTTHPRGVPGERYLGVDRLQA